MDEETFLPLHGDEVTDQSLAQRAINYIELTKPCFNLFNWRRLKYLIASLVQSVKLRLQVIYPSFPLFQGLVECAVCPSFSNEFDEIDQPFLL